MPSARVIFMPTVPAATPSAGAPLQPTRREARLVDFDPHASGRVGMRRGAFQRFAVLADAATAESRSLVWMVAANESRYYRARFPSKMTRAPKNPGPVSLV